MSSAFCFMSVAYAAAECFKSMLHTTALETDDLIRKSVKNETTRMFSAASVSMLVHSRASVRVNP